MRRKALRCKPWLVCCLCSRRLCSVAGWLSSPPCVVSGVQWGCLGFLICLHALWPSGASRH